MNLRKWLSMCALPVLCLLSTVSHAQNTTMSIVSEPGDYIGQGQTFTSSAVLVNAPYQNGTVQITAYAAPNRMYSVTFGVSGSLPILPGVYENLSNYGLPSIGVSGDGRGCIGTGRFEILEALFDANGQAQRFRANFEYHCGGMDQPGLFGEISIVGPPPPRLAIDFNIDEEIGLNRVTGRVVVAGTIRCSLPTTMQYALISLSQEVQHFGAFSGYSVQQGFECSPEGRRFTAEIEPEFNSPVPPGFGFRRGAANVFVYAYALDPNYSSEQGYVADHPTTLVIGNP